MLSMKSENMTINIATEFSRYPAGRFLTDGPFSGQKFRDEYLIPAIENLSEGALIIINLDGTRGYGSSFLEEAFGGLFRKLKTFTLEQFKKTIKLNTSDPSIEEEIFEYITKAYGSNT